MALFVSNFVPTLKVRTDQGNVYCGFDDNILTKNPPEKEITGDAYTIGDKKVIVLHDVFSGKECDELIYCSELCGYESLSRIYAADYRVNDRVMVDDVPFVYTWYERMKPILENKYQIDTTTYFCLNPRLRISKYVKSGFFAPHYDTPVSHNNLISNYTVLAYLNDVAEKDGGATRFYFEKDGEIYHGFRPLCVHPKRGSVVIFPHDMCHDGQELYYGNKYVVRTEIMRNG
jgi:hypothetical protein